MLARLARWNCRESSREEARNRFRSLALPILQAQEGFVEASLLEDPDTAQRIAFTLWRDRQAYRRFVSGPDLRRITEAFADLYVDGDAPVAESWQIRASSRRDAAETR